ncbi:hypothetical protein GCM10010174_30600 [Kutzneria viridogrisea]|uniref:Asp23/Gls24 family envelope stress response protein n=1 Tax=Kutzneria viridogrisea TaxID=47990 RepID=A0ABR6BR21_9PSEU|nr:hypothetical protein [Kutzneria viridogrisea]
MTEPDTGEDLATAVRAVLAEVGGLHPAVAEDAPITKVPGVDEPWITATADRLVVRVVADAEAMPVLPKLLLARQALTSAFELDVELRLVDLVDRPPDE